MKRYIKITAPMPPRAGVRDVATTIPDGAGTVTRPAEGLGGAGKRIFVRMGLPQTMTGLGPTPSKLQCDRLIKRIPPNCIADMPGETAIHAGGAILR